MSPLTATEIKSAYGRAMALLSESKAEEALALLGRIVEANPRIPEVHFQIARIFLSADRHDRALTHFEAAAALKPAEPAIWRGWAGAVALAGDPKTEAAYLAAVKAAPLAPALKLALQDRFGARRKASKPALGDAPPTEAAALVAAMGKGRYAEVEAKALALLRKHPGSAVMANLAASAMAAAGKAGPAQALFRDAAKIDPDYAEAHSNLGRLLLEMGRPDEAKAAFREALARAPEMPVALLNLAMLHTRSGHAAKAVPLIDRVLRQEPASVPALVAKGNALTRLRDYEGAEAALRKAVEKAGGRSAEALAMLAQAEARLGRDDEALAHYDAALVIDPNQPVAQGGKAALLQTLGRFDEAETWFRRVFETDPDNGENYRLFITSHKTKAGDPILAQMEAKLADPRLGETDRMNLSFALAKALEDVKDYDRVFAYLDAANALMRKAYPYDIAARDREIEMVQAAMSGIDWHATRIEGASDYAPIFVTGMPRSGTTLVEQIIASHSQVEGAGEVGDGTREAQRLLSDGKGGLRPVGQVPHAEIAALGHDYAAMLRARFPDAPHVTDKSIQTYLFLGLMKLALPKARFVVVRRDPRDTLLSIYKNKFPEGTHLYAYDQRDLAKYYGTFERMIDFWRAQVPDWFYEVQYEALVANPEEESRKLIAACGLEWEDTCLNFHQNRNKVETLSVFQVRQPISGGSVKAWQRYEAELAPMLTSLAEDGYAPA